MVGAESAIGGHRLAKVVSTSQRRHGDAYLEGFMPS